MNLKDCIELKVDYMEMSTGRIYKIQDYFHREKLGLPNHGIEVVDAQGYTVGYVNPAEFLRKDD